MATASIESALPATSVSLPAALSTFPQFSNLPMELQLKIWKIAASIPRIVKFIKTSEPNGSRWQQRLKVHCDIPAILHANLAARQVGRKEYEAIFATEIGRPKFYFNFVSDSVFLFDIRDAWLLQSPWDQNPFLSRVQTLVIGVRDHPYNDYPMWEMFAGIWKALKAVKLFGRVGEGDGLERASKRPFSKKPPDGLSTQDPEIVLLPLTAHEIRESEDFYDKFFHTS